MKLERYLNRESAILELASGRRILHLGCVGNNELSPEARVRLAPQTLHWRLSEASDVVGVDYSVEVIEEYKRLGIFNNIISGDVQRLQDIGLCGTFDVIIASDIIEHLSNPGDMLSGLRMFCAEHSKVILTTPHAFGLPNYLRFLSGTFHEAEEHVMTFNKFNLVHLLKRHGFCVESLDTCFQSSAALKTNRILFSLGCSLFRRVPELGGTLFVVARYKGDHA